MESKPCLELFLGRFHGGFFIWDELEKSCGRKMCKNQGFQTRPGVLTRGGERVKGSEVQPGRTGVQPDG